MSIRKTNPITGYELALMPPTGPQDAGFFGWIRLVNRGEDAGYVYLQDTPVEPRLNSKGTYIVTSVRPDFLSVMLDILRNEKNLQIDFFDPQAAGSTPSVFIGTINSPTGAAGIASITNNDILLAAATTVGRPIV